ncbi:aldehyde:ferredoxin oxidoreductase [Candidatus Hakubella thermalkaliphila]|uniref:Aldehyde:ferredoxin oxidoreductase n=1 Tax=Candidatus Hakubella thermalkaliphila TaxID=2754717 RepID=A0A6V8NQM0_9ACTN|nr:aldehyde ferredoxin oxidoreductase family protein [Candidatus Hakubella thermalkaliphila]GFP21660.1 aldehyde:ferredoxin oxidoreductase [Candidatus Hakubella thermalkaliphila]
MGGYARKILEVDLSTGKIETLSIKEEDQRKFLGGSGLAAKIFFDSFNPKVDPLSPENPLIVMTGPVVGTQFPGTSRFTVCGKSPLTGIWGEGTCGGNFGPELKFAGMDGIIFKGASSTPVYLSIENDEIKLRDASDLWGMDNYTVTDFLKRRLGKERNPKVLSIGPAGENLVKFAAICNDKGNFIGRTGMGAVMGSKRLKAVVVKGTKKVEISYPEEYATLRKLLIAKSRDAMMAQSFRSMGTDAGMDLGMLTGDVPIKNWMIGEDFQLSANLGGPSMTEKYLTKNHACSFCPIACKRIVKVDGGPFKTEEGPGPEYETCCTFGTLIMNYNLAGVIKANEWCNRYGMDTISCGATIAFAMEAFERGLINKRDTDGIDLTWGNMAGVIELLHQIAKKEGIGAVLSEGTREAAKRLGKGAEEFAVEVPMHDPRGFHGMGLAYMTSIRGACHLMHLALSVEQGINTYAEVGFQENYIGQRSEGKAEMIKLCEDLGLPCNSLLICQFVAWTLSAHELAEMVRVSTGFDMTLKDLLTCGERTWLLKRGLGNMMGVKVKDDRLPKRILTPLKEGAAVGSVPDVGRLLREYYEVRGLDGDGRPKKEVLIKAGLEDLAKRLHG